VFILSAILELCLTFVYPQTTPIIFYWVIGYKNPISLGILENLFLLANGNRNNLVWLFMDFFNLLFDGFIFLSLFQKDCRGHSRVGVGVGIWVASISGVGIWVSSIGQNLWVSLGFWFWGGESDGQKGEEESDLKIEK
jgi:hypothetical protein